MIDAEFRAWDSDEKKFWYFTLQEILERRMSYRGSFDEKILKGEKSQYTGFKDSKRTEEYPEGQKIFEGDVIGCECEWNEDGYYESGWTFVLDDIKNVLLNLSGSDRVEVIGNIYENPELSNLENSL